MGGATVISDEELREALMILEPPTSDFGKLLLKALAELAERRRTLPRHDSVWQPIPADGKIKADGMVIVRRQKGHNRAGFMTYSVGLAYYSKGGAWVVDNGASNINDFSEYMEIPE